MNFVNHLNLFGVEAKETPCIKGTGAPSKTTEGAVGVLYMDTNTGYIYKCISIVENEFIWESIQPQANWEQADETAADYIKNKTHWTEYITEISFDGNITGRPIVYLEDFEKSFIKLSDDYFLPE
jgi:hypothetical protein